MASIPNNYDSWSMKSPTKVRVDTKIHRVLQLMEIGVALSRPSMLRAADIEPNGPGSSQDYTDYHMYKMGLLDIVGVQGSSKVFQITQKGRDVLAKLDAGEKAISV
jgi:hypothetical protein